jgi:hypothetical protein
MTHALLRRRHDGWTPDRQAAFVAARAAGASIAVAAAGVGMSRRAVYRLRAHPAGAGIAATWPTPMLPSEGAALLDDTLAAIGLSEVDLAMTDAALIRAMNKIARLS